MGGWRWQKHDLISLQQILRKFFSLLGCLLTVPHQTLQDPHTLQVSLPWNLRHLRGLLIALKC